MCVFSFFWWTQRDEKRDRIYAYIFSPLKHWRICIYLFPLLDYSFLLSTTLVLFLLMQIITCLFETLTAQEILLFFSYCTYTWGGRSKTSQAKPLAYSRAFWSWTFSFLRSLLFYLSHAWELLQISTWKIASLWFCLSYAWAANFVLFLSMQIRTHLRQRMHREDCYSSSITYRCGWISNPKSNFCQEFWVAELSLLFSFSLLISCLERRGIH